RRRSAGRPRRAPRNPRPRGDRPAGRGPACVAARRGAGPGARRSIGRAGAALGRAHRPGPDSGRADRRRLARGRGPLRPHARPRLDPLPAPCPAGERSRRLESLHPPRHRRLHRGDEPVTQPGRDVNSVDEIVVERAPAVVEAVIHDIELHSDVLFTWDYERSRTALVKLYEKAKTSQWNATTDLPWDTTVDWDKLAAEPSTQNQRFQVRRNYGDSPLAAWGEKEGRGVRARVQAGRS